MREDWIFSRVAFIRGLKSPSDAQKLLVVLYDKKVRDKEDERKFLALVRSEHATEKAQKARANAAKIINADKEQERKARNHELFNAAGLLILASLVDTKTGLTKIPAGELLGALLEIGQSNISQQKRAEWRAMGDACLMAQAEKKAQGKV